LLPPALNVFYTYQGDHHSVEMPHHMSPLLYGTTEAQHRAWPTSHFLTIPPAICPLGPHAEGPQVVSEWVLILHLLHWNWA
jgi:hypothetical protein